MLPLSTKHGLEN